MRCREMPPAEEMERYLRGELEEGAASAFEEHYFACDACFAALEDLRALRGELARTRTKVRLEGMMSRPLPWVGLAAALLAMGVAGAFLLSRERAAPVAEPKPATATATATATARATARATTVSTATVLAEVARVEPPPWTPVRLRGDEGEAGQRFRAAMELYGKGDRAGALPILREAAALDLAAPGAWFYRGACALLAGEADEAVESLERVVALGETPYLEEAQFYLAKARLARGEVPAARRELERVAGSECPRQAEARLLIERLDTLGRVAP